MKTNYQTIIEPCSDESVAFIKAQFIELLKIPCWGVRQGLGTALHLQFGQPHLEVRQPNKSATRESLKRRSVYVEGDWTLSIDCCEWHCKQDGALIACSHFEDSEILKAVYALDSRSLTSVAIEVDSGITTLVFEDGIHLTITPDREDYAAWELFTPLRQTIQVKAKGLVAISDKHTICGDEVWTKLTSNLNAATQNPI